MQGLCRPCCRLTTTRSRSAQTATSTLRRGPILRTLTCRAALVRRSASVGGWLLVLRWLRAACGGLLKPDVVFFGENVPKDVVERAFAAVRQSDGIVAAGSSLQVYSIYRFIRAAVEQSIPVAIVNIGPTRGDDDVALRVPALTSTTFKRLAHCFAPDEFERLAAMPLGKTFW
eukprot:Unigene4655_Nuclearia_a/m.14221 Unigene4655_Nuclearia_a/g.14221  ORF Unigene4655_Nuclearia_a/g.14221 Unigene4655_Nuclearia_a/m.14221 type:complete len:173 (+) Unigene4655_Nuclearia_a:708-1226(+)